MTSKQRHSELAIPIRNSEPQYLLPNATSREIVGIGGKATSVLLSPYFGVMLDPYFATINILLVNIRHIGITTPPLLMIKEGIP